MVQAFEYACAHPFLLFLPALIFFLLPVFPAIARKERERAERRKAAEKQRRAAAEEKRRKAEEKQAAPDPNAPKRKPGRPRKAATEQRPEIISNPVFTPDEFIEHIG